VLAVRSMDRLSVVLLPSPPDEATRSRVRAFAARLAFDVVRPLEDRPSDPVHQTDTPLLAPGEDYPFDVRPVTDARPYFHRDFRWSRLGDVLDRDAVPFVQWGFVAVLVAFLQVVALAALLLLLPLTLRRAARAPAPLFLALGAGYALLEMAFLGRATVLLGGPVPAAAAVLGGFLVGSGAGSLLGERLGRPLRTAALATASLALPVFAFPLPATPALVAFACALVALPMGMPFPAALARLPERSVPWAFAVGGFASVAATAGAPLLSSSIALGATAAAGAALYLLVAILAGRRAADSGPRIENVRP